MKKSTRRISVVLAAAAILSTTALSVSAGGILKGGNGCAIADEEVRPSCGRQIFVGTRTELTPASGIADPTDSATVFVARETERCIEVTPPKKPCEPYQKPCEPARGLVGAKYCTPDEAKAALEEYFADNTYDMYMTEGQEKTFCEGAYYYSTDPDVVYYDYYTGTLVGEKNGTADVYVYTTGGVPIYKLHVTVSRLWATHKVYPTLSIVPGEWRLDVGEETKLSITASDGEDYDDIEVSVVKGADIASLTQISHELTAKKNGAVIIYAYSKSNPKICGETIVYIGPYEYSVPDGCWSYGKDCVNVSKWYDFRDVDRYSYISGWIKSAEGILIPVVKVSDAKVYDGGEVKDTTIVTVGATTYADLIRQAYGDRDTMLGIINKYNLAKYGITDHPCADPRLFCMTQMFRYIG